MKWSRRQRIVTALVTVIVVFIVAVVVYCIHGAGEYYAISPGSAPVVSASATCKPAGGGNLRLPDGQVCVRLDVPAARTHTVDGSIMMVDVLQGKATPWQFFLKKVGLLHWAQDGTVLLPNAEILGDSPASQLQCQANQQMAQARDFASVAALRTLGYTVTEHDIGAQVVVVTSGSPAAKGGMECNDLIASVDNHAISTAQGLTQLIGTLEPGDVAHVRVTRTAQNGKQETVQLSVILGATPAKDRSTDSNRAFMGIQQQTLSTFTYPFDLNVNVGAIGGPSAGLALTLGFIDSLSNGELTGGHNIAATGTIDPRGDVGAVGGVAQKTVAVRRAGAQYFFVPVANLKDTKGETGKMKVFAVSNLGQVVRDLESIGGTLPTVTTSTASTSHA